MLKTLTIEELLFNDEPITINRKLAKCIGLKEAVIFQQIHYWLKINEKKNNNFIDGHYWTYNSVKKWHEQEFDFLSVRTVERILQKLEKEGLLISNTFNKMKGDKTKWYTINYNKLLEVCNNNLNKQQDISIKRSQIGKMGALVKKSKNNNDTIQPNWQHGGAYNQIGNTIQPNWQNDTTKLAEPIPKTTTKISTKISTSSCSSVHQSDSLITFFNNEICELKKTTSIKFLNYVNTYDEDFIKAIIEYCSEIGIRSFAGFKKVIDSYISKNILTREDLLADIEKFRADKKAKQEKRNNRKQYVKNKVDTFNDYEQRSYDFNDLEKKLLGWEESNDISEPDKSEIISDEQSDLQAYLERRNGANVED